MPGNQCVREENVGYWRTVLTKSAAQLFGMLQEIERA